jgi:hypothetical protein
MDVLSCPKRKRHKQGRKRTVKKIKMLEACSLPGKRYPQKNDVIDVEDEEAERLVNSKLAEPAQEEVEEPEGHTKRRKK